MMSRALSVFSRNSFQPLDPFDVTQGLRFAQGLRHSAISSETEKILLCPPFQKEVRERRLRMLRTTSWFYLLKESPAPMALGAQSSPQVCF